MSVAEVTKVMSESEGLKVQCVEKDGESWTGVVEVFESEFDNEDDEFGGGASICVTRDDGTSALVYAEEIESIAVVEGWACG